MIKTLSSKVCYQARRSERYQEFFRNASTIATSSFGTNKGLTKNAKFSSMSEEVTATILENSNSNIARSPVFIPTPERKYRYFQNVEITNEGIAIVRFDNIHKPVNTLTFTLREEAERLWNDDIHDNELIKGVLFASGKKDNFIAGADLNDIKEIDDKRKVIKVAEGGLKFFQHMRSKNIPLVCAIDGPALGGGLEWALWCDYRVCTDSSKTKLGLPEVQLGLMPGFGGTQNLHPLVGLQKAMDMLLTGKEVRPQQAKKMGLVDLVVAPQSLEQVAIDSAIGLANGTIKSSKKKKSMMDKAIEDTSVGQYFMWQQIDEMVQKSTNGNYPAPFAIIDAVKYGLTRPKGNEKFKHEREEFAKLAATSESEALIGIFDGMNQMKKHEYGALDHPVKKVAVMGAGLMVRNFMNMYQANNETTRCI